MTDVQRLTLKEEATLRGRAAVLHPGDPVAWSNLTVDRLLATLDFERQAYAELLAASRLIIKAGVSNRSGPKYQEKVAAFDALDDALEALGG
jgi:hypothetical protein